MDDLTREELERLYSVFRDQTQEILDEMSQDILALESNSEDADIMGRLRRGAHTIKGDSACVGLEGVTEVAHRLEDVFDAVVNGKVVLGRDVIDLLLEGIDVIRNSICGNEVEDIPLKELGHLLDRISSVELGGSGGEKAGSAELEQEPSSVSISSAGTSKEASIKGKREYVRVEATRIDALLDLAGEMVVARSFLNQMADEVVQVLPENELADRYRESGMRMGRLVAEMQKSILKMRMVPINQVFKRFARPMRDLAAERSKLLEFEISGGETELDRVLIDMLYEPLLHILRNAVDHGLETEDERRAAGKPGMGKLSLHAYHEGNQVVVEVGDDGRGIDRELLKAKAVQMGAISEEEARGLSDDGALELVYLAGLSTARGVTHISGRGIGGATIKDAIQQLRGSISVSSEFGRGTVFTIRLPLTLAIIRALLFTSGGRLFAFPLLAVSEVVRAEPEEVIFLNGIENYRLREEFISLVRPGEVLGFDRRKGGAGAALRGKGTEFFIIVLEVGSKKYGVVADFLVRDQELVIKPLESEWVRSDVFAGASVLGDGRVALIMDAGMLFLKAIKFERDRGSVKEIYAVRA